MSTIYYRSNRQNSNWIEQILLALLAGFLIFGVVVLLTFFGTRLWYAGRVFPGVSMAGIPVGGLSVSDATALITEKINYPQNGKIVLRDGDKIWVATPSELGLTIDPEASARAAFAVGRTGSLPNLIRTQIEAAASGHDASPIMVFDQRAAYAYLNTLAAQINTPPVDAGLSLKGTEVVATPGQVGRHLDIDATLLLVSAKVQEIHDGVVDLYIRETQPVILDASAEADQARKILSAPLVLSLPDGDSNPDGPWTFEPDKLAQMLAVQRSDTPEGPRYQIGMRSDQILSFLGDLAPKLVRSPKNPRVTFNDDTKQFDIIEHAVVGRQLDIQASLTAINEKLRAGEHNIALVVNYTNPPVTDATTAQQLGITELIKSTTTYFRGSSTARVQNIKAASSKFHGVLVPPGATFSMADTIGDITLDNGFAEALIIIGGQTIKGVGGGVCQVSTTLFRNAFFAGFPIVERYAHAYRVGYYEQRPKSGYDTSMAGLDATVYVPIVDFKFTNDTPHWLLMETYVEGYSLTWKFYSTSDGRSVDWSTTGPTNIVPAPDPIYRENPDLAKGEIKQVDWAAEGSDVTVSRTVNRDGTVYFKDTIATHYQPWQDVFEYGPGTDLPPKN
jgi:vancomycin resistance protein YoaR